jgi:uncharacterized repeat protein (TIGR01451 family)
MTAAATTERAPCSASTTTTLRHVRAVRRVAAPALSWLLLGAACAAESTGAADSLLAGPGSPRVDLRAVLAVDQTKVVVGDEVSFSTVVRNAGENAASVVVFDTMPTGLRYLDGAVSAGTYDSQRGEWAVGELAPGDSAMMTKAIRVTSAAAPLTEARVHARAVRALELVPTDNIARATLQVALLTIEPSFDDGIDALVHADDFDAYATIDERHLQLLALRRAEGVESHRTFVSDNRMADVPDAAHYRLHGISTPGRGGTGRALRSTFLDLGANQSSTWITWPTSRRKYEPDTATVVVQYWMRTTTPGWQINWPGFKFFEYWHATGTSRSQFSVQGPPGDEKFHFNPESRGTFGLQPEGTVRWASVMDGAWHRVTYMMRPANAFGDARGVARMWIDGRKVIDISVVGASEGYSRLEDIQQLAASPAVYLKWPDVLNTNEGRGVGTLEFDDLRWWVEMER